MRSVSDKQPWKWSDNNIISLSLCLTVTVAVQSDQTLQTEPQQTHPRSVDRHGWCPVFGMLPLLSPWPRPGQGGVD